MRLRFRRGGLRLGLLGMLVGGVMLTLLVGSSAAAPVCSAGTCTDSFGFTSAEQSFVVPAGVTTIHVVAVGGAGQTGTLTAVAGGAAASVSADVAVTPGQTLYVEVGGNGTETGAFGGGGATQLFGGGGGGGASDVRTCSKASVCSGFGTSSDPRLLVAGGGGGSGAAGSAGPEAGAGGSAGATALGGSPGQDSECATGGGGGGGAALDAGGTAGLGGTGGAPNGVDGTVGTPDQGGSGGNNDASGSGAGGGGGFYGGGGGGGGGRGLPCGVRAGGGGGGAGSSYLGSSTSNGSISSTTSSPSVTISYAESLLYNFTGFFKPIQNSPTINVAKAGSGIAIKFSLSGNQGLNIFTAGYPASIPLDPSCLSGGADPESTSPAGSSGLSYNPTTDTYSYNWKTQKSWKGSCRQLVVKLNDGTDHLAYFKFK